MTGTAYLEQALIGSLLVQPAHRRGLPWLAEGDFTDPLCAALWTTLTQGHRWPDGPVNVVDLANRLAETSRDLHPQLRSPAAIAELQINAPVQPHPTAYAGLIVEETIRREVISLGYRLTQIDPGRPEQAQTLVDEVTRQLRGVTSSLTVTPTARPHRHHDHAGPHLTVVPPAAGAGDDSADVGAEWTLVGAIVHDQPRGARAHLQRALSGDDLVHPDTASTWRAVTRLQAAGTPVDEITVYWQLTHTPHASGPSLGQLRDSRALALGYQAAIQAVTVAGITRTTQRLRHTLNAAAPDTDRLDTNADRDQDETPIPTDQLVQRLTQAATELRARTGRLDSPTDPTPEPPHRPPAPATGTTHPRPGR